MPALARLLVITRTVKSIEEPILGRFGQRFLALAYAVILLVPTRVVSGLPHRPLGSCRVD